MNRLSAVECLKENAIEAALLMKMLSHPNRVLIACALAGGELGVGEIARLTAIAQPALSRDLARFRSAGLVETRRQSKAIYYRLADNRLLALLDALGARLDGAGKSTGETSAKTRARPRRVR